MRRRSPMVNRTIRESGIRINSRLPSRGMVPTTQEDQFICRLASRDGWICARTFRMLYIETKDTAHLLKGKWGEPTLRR